MLNKAELRFMRPMNHLLMLSILAVAATLLLVSVPVYADELSELKAMVKALNDRIDSMEAKQKAEAEQRAEAERKAQTAAKVEAEQKALMEPAQAAAQARGPLSKDQQGKVVDMTSNPVMLYSGANTTLRLYGLLEPTLNHANHQTPTGGTTNGYQVSWFSGNRLGFDAMHLLPFGEQMGLPGLVVMSKLEAEYELPTGNMDTANVFFNRDTWVGFYSEDLGKLTFGRQNTLTRDFTQNWGDAYGSPDVTLKEGGYSNVNNFKQFIFYSGGPNGTRLNSGIVWKKDWDGHWLTGLAYAFGSGGNGGSGDVGSGGSVPGDFTKGTSFAASVAYNHLKAGPGEFNLNGSYDRGNVSDLIHESELFGGNYNMGWFRVNAGYAHYTAQQGPSNAAGKRTDNSWTVSFSTTPITKTEFAVGYIRFKGDHAGFNGGGAIINPYGNTAGVTMTADGGKESVFGSIMYHADSSTDFYLAADYFKTTGAWVIHDALGNNGNLYGTGQPYNSVSELAMGVRFKF
jgi:predicted porin